MLLDVPGVQAELPTGVESTGGTGATGAIGMETGVPEEMNGAKYAS
jgi:hypothetical protein